MSICPTCNTTITSGMTACTGCGEPVNPALKQSHPATYAKAFELIARAGGSKAFAFFALEPTLTWKEKLYVYGGTNWPAFLAGPFWYLYHKMFKKALVYLPIALVIMLFATANANNPDEVPPGFAFLWLICFFRANIDLYKTKIENNDGWW